MIWEAVNFMERVDYVFTYKKVHNDVKHENLLEVTSRHKI